jgi:colanic acid biosynthesis protein WcaH
LFLSKADFTQVIAHTPLVSIDLVVKNPQGEFLLGWRTNRPAKHHWFVPGGRILKGECLADAFLRLTQEELGVAIAMTDANWKGLYEHFYDDFVFSDETEKSVTTHYVVLAFELELNQTIEVLPKSQHADYQWMSKQVILTHKQVHNHSRAYFK